MTRKVSKGIEILGSSIVLLIAGVVLFISYVRYLEHTSVFYPGKDLHATPKDMGLKHEDVYFKTEDGFLLHAWYVKVPNPLLTAYSTLVLLKSSCMTSTKLGARLDNWPMLLHLAVPTVLLL